MATLYIRLIVCSKIHRCLGLKREHSNRNKHTTRQHIRIKADLVNLATQLHTPYTPSIYTIHALPPPHKAYLGLCAVRLSSINAKKSMCSRGNAQRFQTLRCAIYLCQTRFSANPYWLAGNRDHQGGSLQIFGTMLMKTVWSEERGEATKAFSTLTPSEGPGVPVCSPVLAQPLFVQ